jgi:hypothetical protein
MKTLNRAYLIVNPTDKFWNLIGPSIEDKDFIAFHEPTLYLIEEEIWDEEIIITKYMKKITLNEINQLTEQHVSLIETENIADYNAFFTFEIGGNVVDCITSPIERL